MLASFSPVSPPRAASHLVVGPLENNTSKSQMYHPRIASPRRDVVVTREAPPARPRPPDIRERNWDHFLVEWLDRPRFQVPPRLCSHPPPYAGESTRLNSKEDVPFRPRPRAHRRRGPARRGSYSSVPGHLMVPPRRRLHLPPGQDRVLPAPDRPPPPPEFRQVGPRRARPGLLRGGLRPFSRLGPARVDTPPPFGTA